MIRRRAEHVADDVDQAVVSPDVDGDGVALKFAGLRSGQLVPEQRGEAAGSVVEVHEKRIPHVALEQVHPRARVVRPLDARHHPRRDEVVHVGHEIVRNDGAGIRSHHDRRRNVLEDIVHDEIVGRRERLDPVTE